MTGQAHISLESETLELNKTLLLQSFSQWEIFNCAVINSLPLKNMIDRKTM